MQWLRRLRSPRAERPAPVAEFMEPRLLFSADLTGGLLLAADAAQDAAENAAEVRTLGADGEYAGTATTANAAPVATNASAVATNYAATALTFEANQGQAGAGVDFTAHGSGYGIALQDGKASLTLLTAGGQRTVTLELAGARAPAGEGENLLATRSNYLLGNDASQWRTGIANYGAVVYRGVYDGVDVRYYGNQRQLEYDFIVAAGGDASAISLRFQGVAGATVADNGDLVLRLAGTDGEVRFRAPVSYQRGDAGLEAVASRYELRADGSIGFVLGDYDRSRALVIDPVLDYASYFGSSGVEGAPAIAVDAAGDVYITGRTTSDPRAGALAGSGDIYVAKFSPDLSQLLFSTRIGGTGDEEGRAIAVDAAGNIAVTGWSESGDFPMQVPADGSRAGTRDAVVFKLNAAGTLVFSTYAGGSGATDSGNAVAMDAAGNVYVAGQASSDPGLLDLVLQLLLGSSDNAFISKYDSAGGLVYQKLFGGNSNDWATGIALGSTSDVYVVGNTESGNWTATSNGADGSLGGAIDGFLLHLDASGNTTYSTYIGAGDADTATGVATDRNGKAYVVGVTRAKNSIPFPTTTGAFQTSTSANNEDTGFFRVYDVAPLAGATSMLYSSYVGGSSPDRPSGVAYANGRVVIVGTASSTDFPVTPDALQATHAGAPLYLLVINPASTGAADLEYGTYYAGSVVTAGGVAVSGNHIYVSAEITGDGWATTGAYQTTRQGNDALVAAFTLPNTAPVLNGVVQPAAILEDGGGGSGFLVSSLLAGQVTDPDPGALRGIAVTASDTTAGSWEYTTDGSTWSTISAPSATSALLLAADGQTAIRFVPAANFNGTVSSGLTFRAWDRNSGIAGGRADTTANGGATAFSSASAGVNITVTAVNDAPVANGDSFTTAEDNALTVNLSQLLANDSDPEGSALNVVSVADGIGGTVTLNGNGTVRFTPTANFNGTASFTYVISDGLLQSAPGTVTLPVTPVNDRPVANADSGVTNQDTPITFTALQLLANDTDAEGAPLTIATVSPGAVLNPDGSVTFTPAAGFRGTTSFSYAASDGSLFSGSATVTVVVNDIPSANADTLAATEDVPVTYAASVLLANDSDTVGSPLVLASVGNAVGGSVVLNPDGSVSFTPLANFNGAASFTYTVTDGMVSSGPATVTVGVAAVNDVPTTAPVTLAPVAEDSGAVTITPGQLRANAQDPDGQVLTLGNLVANTGSLVANGDGTWSLTLPANFNGTVGFTYDLSDGTATVAGAASLTVTAVNDAPVGGADSALAVEDTAATFAAADLLANDADVEGSALAIVGVGNGTGGTAVLNADGSVTFTPDRDFNGAASLTYTVSDGSQSSTVSVGVTVTAVDDAPLITSLNGDPAAGVDIAENGTAVTVVTASDVDTAGPGLVFGIAGGADAALFTIDPATGQLSFTQAADFETPMDAGRDNIYDVVVQVSDGMSVTQQVLAVKVADATEGSAPANLLPPVPAPVPAPDPVVVAVPELVPPVTAGPALPTRNPGPAGSAPAAPAPVVVPVAAAAASGSAGEFAGGTATAAARPPRTSESLQEALGPGMETPIASFKGTPASFDITPVRLVLASDSSRVLQAAVFDRAGLELISTQAGGELVLARFGIDSRSEGARLEDFQRSLRSAAFAGELDRLRDSVRQELDLDKSVAVSVVSVSLGVSVAYVLWLIRGGVLLGSYLSALPAWRLLDPLPVLSRMEEEEEDDEEPLEGEGKDGRGTLRGFG
jgi:hypothetical protein